MTIAVQLDLFKNPKECEVEILRTVVQETRITCDKVRKGTYARLNELMRECVDLKSRLEILEKNICQNSKI